jgi:Helix-turn-helix
MTVIYGYYRGTAGRGEAQQPTVKALLAFATANGVELQLRAESDQSRPSRFADRATGAQLLRGIQQGDMVVIAGIGDAFDLPSDVPATVRKLAGKGASLRVLGLTGLGPLEVVSELAGAFAGLELEVERLKGELSTIQTDVEARVKAITAQTIQLLGSRFGEFTKDLPEVGNVFEHRPEQSALEHIGVAMERRLTKLGISQAELSRRTGIPASTISRVFNTGEGGAVEALCKALWPEPPAPAPSSATPGDGSGKALWAAGFGI